MPAEGAQDEPEAHQGRRRARHQAPGLFQEDERLARATLLLAQGAQEMIDLEILRGGPADLLVDAGGLLEAIAQVEDDRRLQLRLEFGSHQAVPAPAAWIASATTVPTVSWRLQCSYTRRRSSTDAARARSHASARAGRSPWG